MSRNIKHEETNCTVYDNISNEFTALFESDAWVFLTYRLLRIRKTALYHSSRVIRNQAEDESGLILVAIAESSTALSRYSCEPRDCCIVAIAEANSPLTTLMSDCRPQIAV